MLQPKRTKFRKVMKSRNRGLATGHNISFGEIGLTSNWQMSYDGETD